MKTCSESLRLMGTVITLQIEHSDPAPILAEVIRRLEVYNQRFSANDPTSELMKINQAAGKKVVPVHPELFTLICQGKYQSTLPNSLLNIAIGPLVQTWRIGFKDAMVPSFEEIADLLSLSDPKKIMLNETEQSVFLVQPGMKIDLGCLAKGYIADLIADYLKKCHVSSALINLGGNIVVLGSPRPDKSHWTIGIQDQNLPRNNALLALSVQNESVVTSGTYERQLKQGDKTYHHLLNPQTGYPIETDMVSLTILSKRSIEGEIWTTRLFGQPIEDALATLNKTPNIEGVIMSEHARYFSDGIKERLLTIKN